MNSKSLHEIHMMQSASGADPTSPSRNKTSLSLDSRLKSGGTPRGASNGDQHVRSRSNRLQQVQQSSFPGESSASSVCQRLTRSSTPASLIFVHIFKASAPTQYSRPVPRKAPPDRRRTAKREGMEEWIPYRSSLTR